MTLHNRFVRNALKDSYNNSLTNGNKKRIIVSSNNAWNLANFRRPVIEALVAAGHDVIAIAPRDGQEARLTAMGATFRPIRMRSTGTSPFEDSRLLLEYIRAIRAVRADLFLGFTAKPNIYGSLAARMLGVPVVATISGLGSAFLKGRALGWLLLRLYRTALAKAQAIVFQNEADRDLFLAREIARPEQARLVAGSGIDLAHFPPAPIEAHDDIRFLLIARLLLDKGIGEFVEAAGMVRSRHPQTRFQLLGGDGGDNPSAVPRDELERWRVEGLVELLGVREDVRPDIAAADCVVLPSYREGLSRSLLEAAAMARPLIASNVPGCREVVDHQVTGFLCEARSAASLASAMERFISLSIAERGAMGTAGRRKVAAQFDQQQVADFYLAEADQVRARN